MSTEILECGHPESPHSSITRGYGRDLDGNRCCYDCCAEIDREQMRATGKICLYLSRNEQAESPAQGERTYDLVGRSLPRFAPWKVGNWPGSLSFLVHRLNKGAHNWAGVRYDFYFPFEGHWWHGVQYGDDTQIAHCKRTKEKTHAD